ncbi:phosphopentomutase [Thermoanaerobacterium thermosaccharolyticum]|uniref:Phosphopentomutase n=1 Tax=Thermoanaerobacterium thermosaccharolyticum M0795 TaxID=698948 RepID=L0IKQ2_THETR|nr:phosphopentomutase [Thermoanaerobacterium thermosaccharolyticum]AGB19324.1 phosphopentomutase [Thermoanaerobacterium thermosaccharolyticum M0795]
MRAIILVIDSLGVGEMIDVPIVRPQDRGANTLKHVSEINENYRLPNLEAMGIGYLVDSKTLCKVANPIASYGCSNLAHEGADTFQGHQEIVGTKPKKALIRPFKDYIDKVIYELKNAGYKVTVPDINHPFLLVNDLVTIADNIEADLGLNYNVTAPLDYISFEDELKIGKIVRNNVEVGRVIVLGGRGITVNDILNAVEVKGPNIVGINCPKSGVYNKGYMVRHLGYGIDPNTQITTILKKHGYEVSLIGKAADVINCEGADYNPCVDTNGVLNLLLNKLKNVSNGLIMANVQETDLAGHSQNVKNYAEKLKIVDNFIPNVIKNMKEDDILFITGDHGNDPTIGHSHHTREKAALLVYGKNIKTVNLGERETLSDIGATISNYFNTDKTQNGRSFLKLIKDDYCQ